MLKTVKSAAMVSSFSVFGVPPFLTGCGAGIFFERMRGENL